MSPNTRDPGASGSEAKDKDNRFSPTSHTIEDHTVSVATLETGFARIGKADNEGIDLSINGVEALFKDHRIGVDWGLGGCLDEDRYKQEFHEEAARDIRTLKRWASEGALVMLYAPRLWQESEEGEPARAIQFKQQFTDGGGEKALIGCIYPESNIAVRSYEGKNGEEKPLNTLQLHDVVGVSKSDARELFNTKSHPRMSARGWDAKEGELRAAYRRLR